MPPNSLAGLQPQIDAIAQGVVEIKTMMRDFDERVRTLEQREAGCQPIINSRLDAAWRKLDNQETEIARLRELIQAQSTTIGQIQTVLKWLAGIGTAAITAGSIYLLARIFITALGL